MLEFDDLKTELLRMVDDDSIVSATQGILANIGYRKVRRDIANQKPDFFESSKTSITITSGLGDLPLDFIAMREVQDADGNTISKLRRNLIGDDETGSSPLYWYFKRRKSTGDQNRQIGVRPVVASGTIYIYYIGDVDDLDGSDDFIDLPDEDAQRIGLLYSAYEYYQGKRRWGDAQNMLALYTSRLQEHLENFDDEEEEVIEESGGNRGRFTFSN